MHQTRAIAIVDAGVCLCYVGGLWLRGAKSAVRIDVLFVVRTPWDQRNTWMGVPIPTARRKRFDAAFAKLHRLLVFVCFSGACHLC